MPKKPKHETTIRSAAAEYLTFVSTVGEQKNSVELRYEDENIWLTQRLMAELYGVDVRTINYHIKRILEDHELDENSVIRKYWITASNVKTYKTNHYSLHLIITVGFKTNNERVTQVRM
jgi:hypothetical protein